MTRRIRRLARRHHVCLEGLDKRRQRRAVRRAGRGCTVTVVLEFDITRLVQAIARSEQQIRNRFWCIGCRTAGPRHELFGDVCRAIAQDRDAKAQEDAS